MIKKILGATLLLLSTSVFAGLPPVNYTNVTSNSSAKDTQIRAYAGLVWVFNNKASIKPDVTVGVQTLRVKSSDSVSGADFNVRFKIEDGLKPDSNRLSYVGGERNAQGQLGFGYSYSQNSWLTTGAISGPFSKIGTDYLFNKKSFDPFIEINTMKKPDKVNGSSSVNCVGDDGSISSGPCTAK
jgi:hypothetical protein